MKTKLTLIKELFVYGVIGLISSSIDAILFKILFTTVISNFLLVNCLSVTIGILVSFTLNLFINFRTFNNILKRFISFFLIGLVGMMISNVILTIGGNIDIDIFIIKLISIVIVALIQFVLNKLISFRKMEEK